MCAVSSVLPRGAYLMTKPSPHRRALLAGGIGAALAPLVSAPSLYRCQPANRQDFEGYGVLYLPLLVMERQRLFEAHARQRGLGKVQVEWVLLDGGQLGQRRDDGRHARLLRRRRARVHRAVGTRARHSNVEVIGISGCPPPRCR